jgi:hypothetical protein
MPQDPAKTAIFHITDIANLPSILAVGGLLSDAKLAGKAYAGIGYGHIKERRLTRYRIPCCDNRLVGDFVPFYFCPRSPMLYTINRGNTGRTPGCQRDIVHLVSTVADGIALGRPWAISDGNAGSDHADFESDVAALDGLDWEAIRTTDWQRRTHEKSAEFLVADSYDWTAIRWVGCHDARAAAKVNSLLVAAKHQPEVLSKPNWYY